MTCEGVNVGSRDIATDSADKLEKICGCCIEKSSA
jgi:hypothetical protein